MPTALPNFSLPRIRPLLRFTLGALLAVTLALIALPWWLGLVLPAIAGSAGATFARYERLSYARFALRDLSIRLDGTTLSSARVEADSPLVWLFRRAFTQPGPITVTTWRAEIAPSSVPASNPTGWLPLRAQLRSALTSIRPWLPRATLGPGELTAPNFALKVNAATWENSTLTLRAVSTPPAPITADLTLALFPQNKNLLQLTVAVAHPTYPARLAIESRAAALTGQLTFLDQPAHLAATFAPTGWLPATASLRADAWNLPGSRLPLFSDYATLRGSARFDWRDAQLTLSADAAGAPAPSSSAPPLTAQLQARSDGTTLQLTALHVTAPGLRADLTAPVVIDRRGKLLSGDSRFTLNADLAAWPQLTAQGTVTGEARVTPGPARLPRVDFQLAAKSLAVRTWQLSALTATGRLDWPALTLTTAALESTNADRLTITGGYDFSSREVRDAHVSGRIARATLAPLLPAALDFTTLALDARATGPLNALAHSGKLTIDALTVPPAPTLKPLALTATWQGLDRTLAAFSATAAAGSTRLTAAGYSTTDAITLTAFSFGALLLTSPATLRWAPEPQLAAFNLASADSSSGLSAAFRLGPAGMVDVAVKNFASSALADLITLPAPAWAITALALNGSWDRGPLAFTTTADATLALGENQSARVNLSATGDATGIELAVLNVLADGETALRASGRLPLTLDLQAGPLPVILPAAPLTLNVITEPTARFWSQLQVLTGIELIAPRLDAKITGTWSQPRGTATLHATRLALDPARFNVNLPAVDSVTLDLVGEMDGLVLKNFSARLDGQSVHASGRLPVAAGGWVALRTTVLATLADFAEFRIEIPDADIAAVAHHLPDYLAPQGRLALDLALKPGGNLEGTLRLRDAASRPLGLLGAVQDINADLRVSGRTLTLQTVNARTGGQPLTLDGTIALPRDAPPQLDLTLKGENLPLVRQLGLLLRGDLNLRLTTPSTGVTRLGGTVQLQNSLFLADVRDLLPSGERGSSARAPYFAIETAPFNRWQLDLAVDGDRFLRVRTALFTGVASAHFRLSGTLGNPLALGEAEVADGKVRLPFATFAVQQSSFRLAAGNPHDPALWVTGTTRRAGYDLRLELGGVLSAPVLTFSSSPALDSKQVLLLVMTGQLPTGTGGASSTQRATRLGTYLGRSLLGSLSGDEAAGDRLNFTTGERISRQGRETFGLEYRLDQRWSLVGEYDEFDDYNAGVKWRIIAAPVSAAP